MAKLIRSWRKLYNLKLFYLQSVRYLTTSRPHKNSFDNIKLADAKPFDQIPSLPMVPLLGTAWVYLPIVGRHDIKKQHLATIDKRRRLGNIIREKFGPINMVISFNPDDMQVIFQNEGPYPSRGEFTSLKAYRESRKEWYTSTGLLLLQGQEWRDLRSKTQKHLMKPKAVQSFLYPMQDVTRDFVDRMFMIRDNNKEIPNFINDLYKWALESIALVGLDTRLGCFDENASKDSDGQKMINAVQTQFECMSKLEGSFGNVPLWKIFPTPTWKRFVKAGDTFTELNPIIDAVVRSIDHDVVFSGYRIPAGTFLIIGYEVILMDDKYFPNPTQFLPERWLKKDDKMHPFAFVPFGVGPRSCIGRRLAEQEIICLISEIVRNFKVEYHHEDIGMINRLGNTPDKPLRFAFYER